MSHGGGIVRYRPQHASNSETASGGNEHERMRQKLEKPEKIGS